MKGSNQKNPASKLAPGKKGRKQKPDLSEAIARAPSAAKQVARLTLAELVQGGRVPIFLDANVLIPEYLRTVFLDMAEAGLFQPYWSPGVLAEMRRNLIDPDVYGLEVAKVDRLLKCLEQGFPNALVQGSEKYEVAFSGKTDRKDRHVAAGALKVSQSVHEGLPVLLVTENAKDLPQWAFEGSHVLRVRPDTLLTEVAKTWPTETDSALRSMLRRLKNPKVTETDLLDYMVGSSCSDFAGELAKLWGYELVEELTPARQQQLPKSVSPPVPTKKAAAPKAVNTAKPKNPRQARLPEAK
jgi:hypothetical protein